MINFIELRKKFYKDVFHKFKTKRLGKNYSKIIALVCLEIGVLLTYLFLKIKIKPNTVTCIFILTIFLATIFIGSGNKDLTLIGIIIYFFKNSLDLSDGFLARLTRQTSHMGSILDIWAGFVSIIFFQIALGLYVYVKSLEPIFLIFTLIIVVLNTVDFKKVYLIECLNNKKMKPFSIKEDFRKQKKRNFLIRFFGLLDYDGRSRYTDLVLLVILINFYNYNLFLSKYVLILLLITNTSKFIYKFYKTIKRFG